MNFTVPIYQRRDGGDWECWTLGLGPFGEYDTGPNVVKVHRRIADALKARIAGMTPTDLEAFVMHRGLELVRLKLELKLRGAGERRRVSSEFPVILQPRWTTEAHRIRIAYHPQAQDDWFPVHEDRPLDEQAAQHFQRTWAYYDDDTIDDMRTDGKDSIRAVAFSTPVPALLDDLPDLVKDLWDDLETDAQPRRRKRKRRGGYRILPSIGVNLTPKAVDGTLPIGQPRSPYREQLQQLLIGPQKRPTLLVGPPGVGKTTLLYRWIKDLTDAEGYPAHRNLDQLTDVWSISAKRIIAGMSYVGDWEQRCTEILEDARSRRGRVILVVEDVTSFGQVGRTRESDRNLADFFRGPLNRGDVIMVGECTPEQLQRLEDESPSFAAQFTRLYVQPTDATETLKLLVPAARVLERKHRVHFDPFVFRRVLELGGALFPGAAFPGKAFDLLDQLATSYALPGVTYEIDHTDVVSLLAERTGLPEDLLRAEVALDPVQVEGAFRHQVMGQETAVAATRDLVLRIKTGLTEATRPYGVYLFTGPTGTGKTELAKCIAAWLYGDAKRLLRFDMSEYSSSDAPARLIGDRWAPEGLLVRRVREQPFCVVLFDEIEKAHRSVLNLLLQLFDEGRLTDAAGNTASFVHTVIIMTSNLGAKSRSVVGFEEGSDAVMKDVASAVREFFPPELFNRIDHVVPFSPLTSEVAAAIASKEMSRLLSRRGLTERNIFVYRSRSVIDRIVQEAFNVEDGARSVKRYLEDHVGTLLAERVAGSTQRRMQIFHVYRGAEAFRLHAEPLRESDPVEARSRLEPLLSAPAADLRKQLRRALRSLAALKRSGDWKALEEEIQHALARQKEGDADAADQLFYLEQGRIRVQEQLDRIDDLLRKAGAPRTHLYNALCEAFFLQRVFRDIQNPARHAIAIKINRIGEAAGERRFSKSVNLLRELTSAYARYAGDLEGAAVQRGAQAIQETDTAAGLNACLDGEPSAVVLRMNGLCVLDMLTGETGCHVWQSLARASEIVRVEVIPAEPGQSSRDVLLSQAAELQAFQDALDAGVDPLPANPTSLLPLVRRIRFDAPRSGGLQPLELEDFWMGYAEELHVATYGEALQHVWRLKMALDVGGKRKERKQERA